MSGRMCSRNVQTSDSSGLMVYVYADSIIDSWQDPREEDVNSILLSGTICKIGEVRTTPNGRVICDMILAVSSGKYHSYYVPCIAWYDTAKRARALGVGSKVCVKGRFQSREYVK